MMNARSSLVSVLVAAVVLLGAGRAPAVADDGAQARRYAACLARADREPKEAFEDAISWRDLGGGPPAEHCAASALVNLGLYIEAARRFEDIARKVNKAPAFKANLLGQAAQAWLLANQPGPAEALATAALKLAPKSIELYIDRAQARATAGDYPAAIADLDAAVELNPKRHDALTFRSSAKRHLKDTAGALADVNAALELRSNHPEALLERGILNRLAGDRAAARRDWLAVLAAAPKSAAADAARANLETMDVKSR